MHLGARGGTGYPVAASAEGGACHQDIGLQAFHILQYSGQRLFLALGKIVVPAHHRSHDGGLVSKGLL